MGEFPLRIGHQLRDIFLPLAHVAGQILEFAAELVLLPI
jgi:hypothetical protein